MVDLSIATLNYQRVFNLFFLRPMIFDDLWMSDWGWGKGFDLRMKHGEFHCPSLGTEGF